MIEAKPFPFDFDAIQKGDVITSDTLEDVMGKRLGTREYDLALLAMKDLVERQLAIRKKLVIVRTSHGCLHILPDNEATVYNAREQDKHVRAVMRCHRRFQRVDTGNLNHEEKLGHDGNVIRSAKMVQSLRAARRDATKAIDCDRKSPAMLTMDSKEHQEAI